MLLPLLLMLDGVLSDPADKPTAQTEILGINVPDEFDAGYHARNETQEITELVVPPEKVETWTSLITLQMFFGAAQRDSLDAFYGKWRDSLRGACAGMTDTMVKGTVDGRPAIRGTLACPNNPQTGKPENIEAVLVQGEANLMMVQVAFRHSIGTADAALIQRVASSLKVCDQRTLQACSKRTASGFQQVK